MVQNKFCYLTHDRFMAVLLLLHFIFRNIISRIRLLILRLHLSTKTMSLEPRLKKKNVYSRRESNVEIKVG
jgi:hypothetical protein